VFGCKPIEARKSVYLAYYQKERKRASDITHPSVQIIWSTRQGALVEGPKSKISCLRVYDSLLTK
jgi:hypothetical protein